MADATRPGRDLSLLEPLFPGAARPDDVLRYGWAGDFPFATAQTAWIRVVDWDGDGKPDVVRYGGFGREQVYLNVGDGQVPRFDPFHTLTLLPSRNLLTETIYGVAPYWHDHVYGVEVVDWDNDGAWDIVVTGKYADGQFAFLLYRNLGTNREPLWAVPVPLSTEEGILFVSPTACPRLVDWDGDGRKDLVYTADRGSSVMYPTGTQMWWCRNVGTDTAPRFAAPQLLTFGGQPLSDYVHGFAWFDVADWDRDGDLDLLLGSGDNNHILFFENLGTRTQPSLATPVLVRDAEGTVITLHEHYVAPAVADLDGDGDLDLLVGTRAGFLYSFENIGQGSDGLPRLKGPIPVTMPVATGARGPLNGGVYISIEVVDWDGDGDLDLLVGNETGNILLFENVGTDQDKRFAAPRPLTTSDDQEIWLVDIADGKLDYTPDRDGSAQRWGRYGYVGVCAADWDGDGDVDLIVSDQSRWLYLIKNVGTRQQPVLAAPRRLEIGGRPYESACRVRPVLRDWDGDGVPDLLHVDADYYLTLHKGERVQGGICIGPPRYLTDAKGQRLKLRPQRASGSSGWNSTPRCQPDVVDWDGDGRLDILVSTVLWASPFADCDLLYFKNVGTNADPVFELRPLLCDGKPFIQPDATHDSSVKAVDWNGDGILDLLVGNMDGWIYFYDGRRLSQ